MTEHIHQSIVNRTIEDEMKESYLRYSMSVIVARALPDARDGLKPSQRRILYAMKQLNLGPQGKHRKCAKISGDTSGDYHPHGEQVIYPTLVRMAQPWAMRYRLVDGQGNFGSVDGDSAAAMRYTEARLTHASMALMEDLEKDTVDHVPNYDETKKEPVVFPSKFPNLLCNGSSGIAVGMATNIPPHNFNELFKAIVLLLDNPQTTIDEIMEVMPGPDFPTGGVICGYRGIKEAFHTGRGKVILRGLVRVEPMEGNGDRERIVIDEIPYNVNKSRLIERIAELIHEKTINGVSDIRDESDKDGMRIVIELKRNEMPEVTINQLYKYSDLQVTFGCNMLALDKGLPRLMNVKQLLVSWMEHRIEVIQRRTRFELAKAEARAHILEGYLKAILHLDEVVKIIRASENRDAAKRELIERFDFSDKQAMAVLDLRLYQLTSLESGKIEEEYANLLKDIAHYKAILASEELVKGIIKDELTEVQKHQKGERRTQIIPAETEMQMEDLIPNTSVIITISEDDYIKRMPVDVFREQKRGGQGVFGVNLKKAEDAVKNFYVASAHDTLMIFTSLGRVYWLKVWQIPEASKKTKGKPLINLLEDIREGEKIATTLTVTSFEEVAYIIMATANGIVKKTDLQNFSNPRRKGVIALDIDEGDELIGARLVREGQEVMLFTYQGMAVRFAQDAVRPMGRAARGVKGVTLKKEGDRVVGLEAVKGDESILVVCENGFGKRSLVDEFRKTNRGGVGVRSIMTSERNGSVIAALSVTDTDGVVLMSSLGQTVRISMKNVRVMGRNTQGVKLAQLKDSDWLIAVQKVVAEEEENSLDPLLEITLNVEIPQESTTSPLEETVQEDVSEEEEDQE